MYIRDICSKLSTGSFLTLQHIPTFAKVPCSSLHLYCHFPLPLSHLTQIKMPNHVLLVPLRRQAKRAQELLQRVH